MECAKELIANGADINAVDDLGKTPLHSTACRGSNECVHKLLIDKQVKISVQDNNGKTALHYAVKTGVAFCTGVLIDTKDTVNVADIANTTPLHIAAEFGYTDCAKLLIDNNAKIDEKDDYYYNDVWTEIAPLEDIYLAKTYERDVQRQGKMIWRNQMK